LYRKNDAADLTYWLQEITVHPEKYLELKKAALERARSVYSWDSVICQYEQLFAKLLREKQNPGVRSQNSE
jgi:glycosyltransferase involved in cell wall biosynthesis